MAKEKDEKKPTHVVAKPFRDIADFDKEWEEGDDVSHFGAERLERAVENGYVTKVEEKQADPPKA